MTTDRAKATSQEAKWIDAIARMIELTQSGELEWELGEYGAPGLGYQTTPPYLAKYRGRIYRLQGTWVESKPDPYPLRNLLSSWRFSSRAETQPMEWEAITLDMVDSRGRRLYRVPYVSPLGDLLRAVQRQTADPNAAIQELLSESTGSYEKPLNQMLLELNEKVPDAVYRDDNTDETRLIEDMRAELEDVPGGGPLVVAEADDRGVYSITTSEEGYSAGLVGNVYEDTGEEDLS